MVTAARLQPGKAIGEIAASTAPINEAPRNEGLQVRLEVIEKVWIRATADGKRVWEKTFRSGERKSIEADQSILLLVGNAGGLKLELNGRPMPDIGPRGQVRRVEFTPSGMHVVEPTRGVPGDRTTTASVVSPILPGSPTAILARNER